MSQKFISQGESESESERVRARARNPAPLFPDGFPRLSLSLRRSGLSLAPSRHKVANWLANQFIVETLAKSPAFQRFAVRKIRRLPR